MLYVKFHFTFCKYIYIYIYRHTHIYIYISHFIYTVSFICYTSSRFIPQLITLSYHSRELRWFRAQPPGHEEESDLGGRHDHEDHGECRSQDRGALGEAPHSQVGHFDHHPTLVRERIKYTLAIESKKCGGEWEINAADKKKQWQWNSNRSG